MLESAQQVERKRGNKPQNYQGDLDSLLHLHWSGFLRNQISFVAFPRPRGVDHFVKN